MSILGPQSAYHIIYIYICIFVCVYVCVCVYIYIGLLQGLSRYEVCEFADPWGAKQLSVQSLRGRGACLTTQTFTSQLQERGLSTYLHEPKSITKKTS